MVGVKERHLVEDTQCHLGEHQQKVLKLDQTKEQII
jgi:hypothetical protein